MRIDSEEQLDVYIKVLASMKRLFGESCRQLITGRVPIIVVHVLGQWIVVAVRDWRHGDVSVRVSSLVGVSASEADDRDGEEDDFGPWREGQDEDEDDFGPWRDEQEDGEPAMARLDEEAAEALIALNHTRGPVVHALDEDDDLVISYTMLGATCTDGKLQRAIRAVAFSSARVRAAFADHASRSVSSRRIVDLVALRESERLDREWQQLTLYDVRDASTLASGPDAETPEQPADEGDKNSQQGDADEEAAS